MSEHFLQSFSGNNFLPTLASYHQQLSIDSSITKALSTDSDRNKSNTDVDGTNNGLLVSFNCRLFARYVMPEQTYNRTSTLSLRTNLSQINKNLKGIQAKTRDLHRSIESMTVMHTNQFALIVWPSKQNNKNYKK